MPAGEYMVSSHAGDFTFTLSGDAWTMVAYTSEILSLRDGDEWIAFMSGEIRLREGDDIEMTSDAQRARTFLKGVQGLVVTSVEDPQQIGELGTVGFDVSNEGRKTVQLWGLGNTSGMYTLDPGAAVRMLWADVAGTAFVIALEAPVEGLPDFVDSMDGVVESVAFD